MKSVNAKKKSTPMSLAVVRPERRHSKVAKWGNSLGFRIPQDAAEQLNLRDGGRVSVEYNTDSITIRPVRATRKKWSEAELLKGVTPEIVGGEVDWGNPAGKELA